MQRRDAGNITINGEEELLLNKSKLTRNELYLKNKKSV